MDVFVEHDDDGGDEGPEEQPVQYHYRTQADIVAQLPSKQGATATVSDHVSRESSTLRRRHTRRSTGTSAVYDAVDGATSDGTVDADTLQRLEQIRSITSSLDAKRKARTELLAGRRIPLRGITRWKYQRSREWSRTKRTIKEFFSNFNMWQGSFKTIEGNFGSSVVSYFQFLKWLVLLNVLSFVFILATIVLPQAFMQPSHFNESIYAGNKEGILSPVQAKAIECTDNYTMAIRQNTEKDAGSRIIDFFQGTGYMEDTYLFMGFYFNKTFIYKDWHSSYNMPLAYILVTGVYLALTLLFMVRYTAKGVRDQLITKGNRFYKSSSLVFCGWDHTLSQEKAARYKHSSLFQEIVRELKTKKRQEKWRRMSSGRKLMIYTLRLLMNLVTVAILAGCAALIYFTVQVWKPELEGKIDNETSDIMKLGIEFLPSITLTFLNLVFPFVFQKIVILEKYAPGLELKITIVRTVLLRLASLVVLAITLLDLITCPGKDRHVCGYCGSIVCWETYVGQELYKLVILDLLVLLGTTFIVEFPRQAIVSKVPQLEFFHQEFDLPVNVLNIVYTQTLSWWGGFYSPLIPFISFAKLIICFYCKKLSLLKNQLPPSRPYRASKSNNFFMLILMVSFTLSALAIAYSIGKIPPSYSCSPFRIHSRPDFIMFNSVSDAIATLPLIVQRILYFVTSWVFYVIVLVVLVLCIYYYNAKTSGSKKVVQLLKEKLSLVEVDKQFLLKQVNEALNPTSTVGS